MSDRGKQLAAAELRVVASVLDPDTTSQATAAANAANVCAEMFTDDNLRELFTSYRRGFRVEYINGRRVAELSAADISMDVKLIVSEYTRRNPPKTCKDAAEWLAEPDEPDDPLIEGLIEVGSMIAFVGPAKAAKSHLAEEAAVCLASGVDFLGHKVKRQRVYVANVEVSAKQYKKRLRAICRGLSVQPSQLRGQLFVDNLRGNTATWGGIMGAAKERQAQVVIIDPFYQVFKGKETDEGACLEAVEEMKKFLAAGFTLFVVFHAPKGYSGDRQVVDMISGSSVLVRFPENVIAILPHAEEKLARVVDCSVLRDHAAIDPFTVKFDNGALVMAPDISPVLKSARGGMMKRQKTSAEKANDNARADDAFKRDALEIASNGELIGKREFLERLGRTAGGSCGQNARSEKLKALVESGTVVEQHELERKDNGGVVNKKHGKTFILSPDAAAKYRKQFDGLGLEF